MPELNVIINGKITETCALTNEPVTLGRDVTNTIVLPEGVISSTHARIRAKPDGWQITDLHSTNGTRVNGQPIQSVYLSHGDRIKIGSAEIVFTDGDGPATLASDSSSGSADYLQSILENKSSDRKSDSSVLPYLVIDESGASLGDDSAMAFVDVEPDTSSQVHATPSVPQKRTIVVGQEGPLRTVSQPAEAEHVAETKLRLVQRVSEQLVRIFEPQQLLNEIMTIVVEQTGADRGLLCLLNDTGQPIPIAARGIRPDQEVRVSRTVLGRLLNGRSGVLINPSPDEDSNVFQSLEDMQVHSTMCTPLWTGDRIVGILSLDSITPGKRFSHQDLELLVAVAHPVAVGIERNRLSHQVDTERQLRDYLSKYLDHRIVEQISHGQGTGHDPLAPVEREVTILFSDIVAFTKMSEALSAVELAEFMRKYLTAMTEAIFSYGGTIDKYIGDGVMALFGAPVKSDNSAESAIRAALVMRDRIKDVDMPGAKGKALRVRTGINTGVVVVGNLGSDRRTEYTALGDAVNVAARLETFARPNEICIDEYTYEKTKGAFAVEEIGTIDVKNRAEPVVVYKVIGTAAGS